MTVKEFYNWCEKRKIENLPMRIIYNCNDDYYALDEYIGEHHIRYGKFEEEDTMESVCLDFTY